MREQLIRVAVPKFMGSEARYCIDIILNKFLGLSYNIISCDGSEFSLTRQGSAGIVVLATDFFEKYSQFGVSRDVMPELPLSVFLPPFSEPPSRENEPLPIIFGKAYCLIELDKIELGLDVFGSVFFMLSRLEELVNEQRDKHMRFEGKSSVAATCGFIDRPIVDEYVEVLWWAIQKVWPDMRRKQRKGGVVVSCDVDHPFYRAGRNPLALLKSLAADVWVRKSLTLAIKRMLNVMFSFFDFFQFDPFYTFKWYVEALKRYNLQGCFYFICDHPAGNIDGNYDVMEPAVLNLIRYLVENGQKVGVHGSYNSMLLRDQIDLEREKMVRAVSKVDTLIDIEGNRQHYLRWRADSTPDYLNSAGYSYDTSGGYADLCGFRFGTSKPFAMWSWIEKKPLDLIQQPLVMMETSLLSKEYMGVSYGKEALHMVSQLHRNATMYGGDFTVLWHNSHLLTEPDRELFTYVMGLSSSA